MTAELTAEQIVTNLLASNEIIKPNSLKVLKSESEHNLGKYLLNRPNVLDIDEEIIEPSKYSFIKGEWKV